MYYKKLKGVIDTEVGYANGNKENPSYEEVKKHLTTHAETLKLEYDNEIISLEKILEHFLRFVDPYSIDKQGEDERSQAGACAEAPDRSDERYSVFHPSWRSRVYRVS